MTEMVTWNIYEDHTTVSIKRSNPRKAKKQYSFNNIPGCVDQRINKKTKLIIGLYRADQANMDNQRGQWVAKCETHGSTMVYETLSEAREQILMPSFWCSDCRNLMGGASNELIELIKKKKRWLERQKAKEKQ